jgi:hypothetical protein
MSSRAHDVVVHERDVSKFLARLVAPYMLLEPFRLSNHIMRAFPAEARFVDSELRRVFDAHGYIMFLPNWLAQRLEYGHDLIYKPALVAGSLRRLEGIYVCTWCSDLRVRICRCVFKV